MIKRISIASIILISIILLLNLVFNFKYSSVEITDMKTIEKGRVLEILPKNNQEYMKIEVLTGKYKNKYCTIKG